MQHIVRYMIVIQNSNVTLNLNIASLLMFSILKKDV